MKKSKLERRKEEAPKKKARQRNLDTEATSTAIPKEESGSLLVKDYNFICQQMEITDEDYKIGCQLMTTLQTLLAKQFPSCKLIWYRNWYLKLRNTTPLNEMIIYVDHQGEL